MEKTPDSRFAPSGDKRPMLPLSLRRFFGSIFLGGKSSKPKSGRARRRLFCEPLERKDLLATIVPSGFTETAVATALSSPTALDIAHDGRVFVAQQNGVIRVVENDALVPTPFASLQVDSTGERGLLGITLDPDFDQNHYLYVYYAATTPSSHNRLSRLTANGDKMVPGSEQVLLDLPPMPSTAIWHMGGAVHFGPDGKLYVSVGDQQNTSNPQSLDNPFGKILRINADGSIPADNPFYNSTSGVNRAIWAYGLRNPYTTAFQPGTGRFFIDDVGNASWEEIDEGAAGRNYGWPTTEGTFDQAKFPDFTEPLYAYSHAHGSAITGGVFYNPITAQFPSEYVGDYFFNDFSTGEIRVFDPTTKNVTLFATKASFPTNLAVSDDGSLYYISRGIGTGVPGTGTGQVFKIQHSVHAAPTITTSPANTLVAVGATATFSVAVTGSEPFTYQWQRDQADIPGATAATFSLPQAELTDSGSKFRVIVTNAFGQATSNEASLSVTTDTPPVATIVSPTEGTTYVGGQAFHVVGTGDDAEDGSLAASQFIWQVDFHHDDHAHPFVPPTGGVSTLDFTIPTVGETDPDVWYRVYLTVIDSLGLSTTTYRDIRPVETNISLQTNSPGFALTLDGQPQTAPLNVLGVIGIQRTLSAPLWQLGPDGNYLFSNWSDGGAATHNISFPAANTTYTANYVKAATTYLSDLAFASTPTNGWGPVERDLSNGEKLAKDGRRITLNGVSYAKGLGVNASSTILYNLAGKYTRFVSDVGVDDEVGAKGNVQFQVFGDGVKLFDSGAMTGASPTQTIDIDVSGRQQLKLVVLPVGSSGYGHADWAGARLLGSATNSNNNPPPSQPPANNPPTPAPANLAAPVSYATGTHTHGVTAVDINGDGIPDLVAAVAGANRISVMIGKGDGTFKPGVNHATGSEPKNVVAADLNGDGKPDLVTPNQNSNTISVFINRGDSTFTSKVDYAATAGAHDIALADFNGDGKIDIAQVGWGASNVRVFFNKGNGTFVPGTNYKVGAAPHSVVAADLNGDGKPDLAIADHNSNNVAVLLNRGAGTFGAAAFNAVGTGPHQLRGGDLNGDGKLDLVAANDGSNNVSVLFGNGNGTFARAANFATGPVPKGVTLGDLNADGLLDIVSANTAGNYPNNNKPGGNTISVLINLGSGKFAKPQIFTTGRTPFSVAIADFDGDGDLDLATANWHTNDVTVLRNKRNG